VLFVSHNMAAIAYLCSRALLLRDGMIAIEGESREVIADYLFDRIRGTDIDYAYTINKELLYLHQESAERIVVEKIDLLTGDGEPLNMIKTGDSLRIRIHYNSLEKLVSPAFVVSLSVVLYMLRELIHELDEDTIRHIKMAMIVIFVYRAMPSVGPGYSWWMMDILKFDEAFFGVLAQIGATLGIIGMWISGKYIVEKSISTVLITLTVIFTILSLPMLGLYYGIHDMIGIDAKTVAIIDTVAVSPFDYIAGVVMLTLRVSCPDLRSHTGRPISGHRHHTNIEYFHVPPTSSLVLRRTVPSNIWSPTLSDPCVSS